MDLFRRKTLPPSKEAAARGRAANPLFQPKHVQHAARVNSQLAAIETEITAAEATMPAIALDAVLTDNHEAGQAAVTNLARLREQRAMLQAALQQVQAAENERQKELRSKAEKARDRALRQHLASMEKEAASVATALITVRDSFRRLAAVAENAHKNLPKHLRNNTAAGLDDILSVGNLRLLCEAIAYKLSQDGLTAAPGADTRPAALSMLERRHDAFLPDLITLVGERVIAPVKRAVDQPPVQIQTAAVPHPVVSAPSPGVVAQPPGASAATQRLPPPQDYTVDLRGQDLGVEKVFEEMEGEEVVGSQIADHLPSTSAVYTEESENF